MKALPSLESSHTLTAIAEEKGEVCGNLDWSFLGSASSHSQFAGVLAGFVLAIMAVLLTQGGNEDKRALALTLFSAAFFVLGVDSVLFGIVAGDQICLRAQIEGLVASGLLTLGAALTLAGLAWLFDISFGGNGAGRQELVRMAVVIAYGTQFVGISLVSGTVQHVLEDLSEHGSLPHWAVWAYTALVLAILAAKIARRPTDLESQGKALRAASYYAIGYTLISVELFGSAMSTKQSLWERPVTNSDFIYVTAIVTLMLPIIGLLLLCRSIPRSSNTSGRQPSPPSGSGTEPAA